MHNYNEDIPTTSCCIIPQLPVSMFIQVGGLGGVEYDLLAKPVGGQVTKLIYLPIMTNLCRSEYGFLVSQNVGTPVSQSNLFCDETICFLIKYNLTSGKIGRGLHDFQRSS